MKKYFVLSTVIMVFAIFLNACDKEGIYNPKEKIKAFYLQYEDEKKNPNRRMDMARQSID